MGRGAPYLPTFARPMRIMFDTLLPRHVGRVPSLRAARAATAAAAAAHDGATTVSSSPAAGRLLRSHVQQLRLDGVSLVDLGSGDGRVVFEAARKGFGRCEGYEINPLLYMFSEAWLLKHRLLGGFSAEPTAGEHHATGHGTAAAGSEARDASSPLSSWPLSLQQPESASAPPIEAAAAATASAAALPLHRPVVRFHLRDFWNVNLGHADVVLV